MTLDERIQALTETMELLASFHKDMERRMEERDAQNATHFAKLDQVAAAIGKVVLEHEERLNRIDPNRKQ